MARLILASRSPRREVLLRQIGLKFEVAPSHAEEQWPEGMVPWDAAERLALEKARAVACRHRAGLVVGADTVVVLDGSILGKPAGNEEAAGMLRRLSGREHQVTTGIAVVDAATGEDRSASVTTLVRFAHLSEELIARYVATGEPLDKAGAYGIQGRGALLVEGIVGCYYNVVGLPLRRLAELLGEFGFDAFRLGIPPTHSRGPGSAAPGSPE